MNAKKLSTKQENLPQDPKDLTEEQRRELKIQFAPGAFDSFDGTQEELEDLMKHIQDMIISGEMFEKSNPVDIDALLESDDPEDQALAKRLLEAFDEDPKDRKLQ